VTSSLDKFRIATKKQWVILKRKEKDRANYQLNDQRMSIKNSTNNLIERVMNTSQTHENSINFLNNFSINF